MIIKGSTKLYTDIIPENQEWKETTIRVDDKYFQVNITKINDLTLIKPVDRITKVCSNCKDKDHKKGYHMYEYEYLFRFDKGHCIDFDPERVINITSAI